MAPLAPERATTNLLFSVVLMWYVTYYDRMHSPNTNVASKTQSSRKQSHVELAATTLFESRASPGWEDVHLLPVSLTDLSLESVDTRVDLLGHMLEAPIMIAAMTGGHPDSLEINRRLATAAGVLGVGIGLGSQRSMLLDASLARTYEVVRSAAPDAFVAANIGVSQLSEHGDAPLTADDINRIIEVVSADALAVHLNAAEELIQPEGDRNTTGFADALARGVSISPIPVIAKETGSGIVRETAERLAEAGVAAIDVGGTGGTSFTKLEGARAGNAGDAIGQRVGETFADWGVPTAVSIMECGSTGPQIIGTGGVRSGLDAAKALALGATAVGIARPILNAALEGEDQVIAYLSEIITELKLAMVLTGTRTIAELRDHKPVTTGRVRQWITQRGMG